MKKRSSKRIATSTYKTRLRSNPKVQRRQPSVSRRSNKTFFCPGCSKKFFNFHSVSEFIANHMKVIPECNIAVVTCDKCKKNFIDEKGFMSHLSRTNKDCLQFHNQCASERAKIESFSTSQISIPEFDPNVQKSLLLNPIRMNSSAQFLTSSVQKISIHQTRTHVHNNPLSNAIEKHKNRIKQSNSPGNDCSDEANNILNNKSTTIPTNNTVFARKQSISQSENLFQDNSVCVEEIATIHETDEVLEDEENTSISSDEIIIGNNNNENLHHSHSQSGDVQVESNPQQFHIDIIDGDHFIDINETHLREMSSVSGDKRYIESLELIQLCMEKNISMTAYKDFMKWRYKNSNSEYYCLDKLFKVAEQRVYGESLAAKMKPKERNLQCPSGRKVTIIRFDIDAAIYDLLSGTNLTSPENMIFDGNIENPFIITNKPFYDDIDQSGVYQETYKLYISHPEHEVLVPIIIYMDETNLDSYSKLVLHPVVMSLGIYNRNTRHLSMSWRTIGYLPNFNESFGNRRFSADDKANDFHYCLRYILNGLERLQQSNDMYNWIFSFPGLSNRKYKRKLVFYLSHVVSDAKENDMICGRMNNRSSTLCLCHDCDIKVKDSDNPDVKCNFLKMKDLETYSTSELNQLSFKKIHPYLAFSSINMGANIYGINGCTPSEPLHQINGGICERLPTTFMMRLSGNQVKVLDSHVAYMCTYFSRQSDRSIYDLKPFRNGVSKVSKLSATEKVSRLLAIFLVLITSDFEKEIIGHPARRSDKSSTNNIISKEEYRQWVAVFEDTLILTAWVYHTNHPKSAFKGGRKSLVAQALVSFVKTFKKIANRQDGMGDKYLKFHQILHLWFITRMFSSLANIDSGRNESHHKKKKEIGSHTQKRIEFFDSQTALKEYYYDLMIKAMIKASMVIPQKFEMTNSNIGKGVCNRNLGRPILSGSQFKLHFDYVNSCLKCLHISRKGKIKGTYQGYILQAIYDKFKGYNDGKPGYQIASITAFTELKIYNDSNSFLVRACPDYRSQREWFDWAVINWDDQNSGNTEAQVLMFLDFSTAKFQKCYGMDGDNSDLRHLELEDKEVAIIHSCKSSNIISKRRPCKAQLNDGYISNKLCHFRDMESTYQHVPVSSIVKPCAVYVDESMDNYPLHSPGKSTKVFVLESKSTWHLHFIDYSDNELLQQADKRKDNDYPVTNERHVFEG